MESGGSKLKLSCSQTIFFELTHCMLELNKKKIFTSNWRLLEVSLWKEGCFKCQLCEGRNISLVKCLIVFYNCAIATLKNKKPFLFWNKYRFTKCCKNSRVLDALSHFPSTATSHIAAVHYCQGTDANTLLLTSL